MSSQISTAASVSTSTTASDALFPNPSQGGSLLARAERAREHLANSSTARLQQSSVPTTQQAPAYDAVQQAMSRFAPSGRMTGQAFERLCLDAGLEDDRFSHSQINLIFARAARPQFAMDNSQLETALGLIAKRKGVPIEDIHASLKTACATAPKASLSLDPLHDLMDLSSLDDDQVQLDSLDIIEDTLRCGEAVLLKGTWLLELGRREGVLPRRSELPSCAIWAPEAIMELVRNAHTRNAAKSEAAVIVAISCMWHDVSHPDPQGEMLQALCACIQKRLTTSSKKQRAIVDVGVFWDYSCLSQEVKTSAQQDDFSRLPHRQQIEAQKAELERSLKRREIWHQHSKVETWIITEESPGIFVCIKSCSS